MKETSIAKPLIIHAEVSYHMNTAPKLLPAQDFDEQRVHLCRLQQSSALIRNILEEKLNFNKLRAKNFLRF
jgi:hypothetical protein